MLLCTDHETRTSRAFRLCGRCDRHQLQTSKQREWAPVRLRRAESGRDSARIRRDVHRRIEHYALHRAWVDVRRSLRPARDAIGNIRTVRPDWTGSAGSDGRYWTDLSAPVTNTATATSTIRETAARSSVFGAGDVT